jgi:hypothetical protein
MGWARPPIRDTVGRHDPARGDGLTRSRCVHGHLAPVAPARIGASSMSTVARGAVAPRSATALRRPAESRGGTGEKRGTRSAGNSALSKC